MVGGGAYIQGVGGSYKHSKKNVSERRDKRV